jgi:endonuclease/exonuclease/phosphatase (EEP) superfamily protein YafD
VSRLRVVSWNVASRGPATAKQQGAFLASLEPHIVLLQEVKAACVSVLAETAGLDWLECSLSLRELMPEDGPGRRLGCAIGGARGVHLDRVGLLTDVPLPERLLIGHLQVDDQPITVASYHAPPGVNWHEKKPQQAVTFARWLAGQAGPCLFGADANTPKTDHPDFAQARTHWHTGDRRLGGAPGDDQLVGPSKIHPLRDALRRWFEDRPNELEAVRRDWPTGPLRISHYTGRRKTMVGNPRRFDSIWVSDHFAVEAVEYPYAESCAAGSDHSAVIADVKLP